MGLSSATSVPVDTSSSDFVREALLRPTCAQLIERLAEDAALLLEAAGFERGLSAKTAERAGTVCALRVIQDPSLAGQLVVSSEVCLTPMPARQGVLQWTLAVAPIELDELGLSAYAPSLTRLDWLVSRTDFSLDTVEGPAQVCAAVETTLLTAWAVQNVRQGRWSPASRMRWAGLLEEWLRP